MARTTHHVDAPVTAVWQVLADGHLYADWVVGAKEVRSVAVTWPAVDSVLQHSFGAGPCVIRDRTRVLEAEPPRRMVLEARALPVGAARVEIVLEAEAGGTDVFMDEVPSRGLGRLIHNPVLDAVLHARNVESLRRLGRLAER